MRKILVLLSLIMISITSAAQLTIDDVINNPLRAKRLKASTSLPDGETYACLEDGKVVAYSFRDGKQVSVLFDCQSTVGEKINDIEGFEMSPDGQKMLVYNNSESIYRHSFTADYYIYNIQSRRLAKLSDNGPQQSPVWSPDGSEVAFVRDNNIFLIKLLYDNSESRVTNDGKRNSIINGIPDWVNEEEFALNTSLCFNADGTMLCWLKYDESDVEQYKLQMFKGMKPENSEYIDYPGEYEYKYPKAGHDNAVVTAWSYDIQSHRIQQIALPKTADDYVCRIFGTENPNSVLLLTLNRHQDCLNVYTANPRSTVCQLLMSEKNDKYVIEDAYSEMVIDGSNIIMLSDRDGYRHIYQYSLNGTMIRSITPAQMDITAIYGIDKVTGDIYYQAAPTPMMRKVYVSHKNGKIDCLTSAEGTNSARFSTSMKYFIHTFSDRNTPFIYTTRTNTGKTLAVLEDNKDVAAKMPGLKMPEKNFFTFTTSAGVNLNGVMILPSDFDPSKKYPVVMHQYSGPGSQQVLDTWTLGSMGEGSIYDAYLCQQGFIVVFVDGRGTGGRGSEFEKCTYLNLGVNESQDQVEAALWLGGQSYVDKNRIAIWGWSYGGFNTLMSMSEGRPVFACGVAIAPPTNWKYYDTIYTERFMRTPKENPTGYETNPISRADKLHGALLLCHGLADDNVHPQNMFEYTEALVQSDKDFRELIYTNRNHSIYGGNTRKHLLRQVTQHFLDNLK